MSIPKQYTIVSTYPEEGSKNIGDKLITEATKQAIRRVKGDVEFRTMWREQDWETVQTAVQEAEAVVFSCLAIRDRMDRVYPYLGRVVDSGVPFGVLASGTSLRPGQLRGDLYSFSNEDAHLLCRASEQALFWGTRGVLTQQFCEKHGVKNAQFTGDIAFADERFEGRSFQRGRAIKRIAISDPHYADAYKKPFMALIEQLRQVFPEAEASVFLHGINPTIEDLCKEDDIPYKRLYEKDGLDTYDEVDLHVGFRVHGHVSALNRRIYSYLLEQDGRGAEYGLSIERKISVPCYRYQLGMVESRKNALRLALGRIVAKSRHVPENAIKQVTALIERDKQSKFSRFVGLGTQIKRFQSSNLRLIKQLP